LGTGLLFFYYSFFSLADGQHHKSANSQRAVNLEITPVNGKDSAQPLTLGNTY
jgi:hypothetical protein